MKKIYIWNFSMIVRRSKFEILTTIRCDYSSGGGTISDLKQMDSSNSASSSMHCGETDGSTIKNWTSEESSYHPEQEEDSTLKI